MSDGLFVKISSTIMSEIETAGQGKAHLYLEMVTTLMGGAVTLYILWMGYQTLAGKIQTPMQDVLWNLAKMAVILAFIDNTGGYLDAALDAMHGLKDGLSGNQAGGVWATLDKMWLQTQTLADSVFNIDDSFVPIKGGTAALLVWAGSLLFMGVAALIFLSADITMTVLGLTAPLFIFCIMFGFLRTMFNNWLQLIFSSILTVMFASLVLDIGTKLMVDVLGQIKGGVSDANLLTMGAMALIVGIVTAGLVFLSGKWATQLAGVGMEGAVQGMAQMGLSMGASAATGGVSKVAEQGSKLGKGVGKGFLEGGDAKTNSATEWFGKQAGRPGGALYKQGKAMAKQAVENMKARNNNP
ncbi:conjugal transfer protein [Pseudomonas syringae]|uniref:type IV secretion system protein n=1 Tax=Pseudomonas syringae TaxID=317 RepID=UPI000C07BDD4|nr:type IV secretion system protein [Pseudomonas syringae]PHN71060.1 conjugal transfer protein [Pseudomonas syringae]